jgi:hypothetical protein
MTDLGGATLLVGVRDNDLKGRDSMALSQLALVHGDPSTQREHCLRNSHEKEPDGSASAVLDGRAFIRERIAQALVGLDATSTPDLAQKTSLPLYLSLRHSVDASLPTYYVRIGQAIHAIEIQLQPFLRLLAERYSRSLSPLPCCTRSVPWMQRMFS